MPARLSHLPPGGGQRLEVLGGDVMTIKASGADTDGRFTVIETIVPPGGGPPRHVHSREDEAFSILEGEFEFYIDNETIPASPGSFLIAPRGVPHTFKNVGNAPGKFLVVCQPAGFDEFALEFAKLPVDQPPDPAKLAEIGAQYGIEFLLG